MIRWIFIGLFALAGVPCAHAAANRSVENVELESPDRQVLVNVFLDDGAPKWSVVYKGKTILQKSSLGLETESKIGASGYRSISAKQATYDSSYQPVWGKFSNIRNHYSELEWHLQENGGEKRSVGIAVRAYNDAVAVRYLLTGRGDDVVTSDNTSFNFSGDYLCWSPNGESANQGPVELSKFGGYQFPLTVKVDDTTYASVLEAAIKDYAHIHPVRIGKTEFRAYTYETSSITLPSSTSWRVLQLGDSPGALLESNILMNLNPPTALKDTSWIKPGLALWDWRAWGGVAEDGFKYNLDMASWRRMIDFASEYGVEYLVLDANWYGHEFDSRSNPMKSRDYIVYQPHDDQPQMADRPAPENWDDPIDIPALIKYGKERNVGVFLYINDVARLNWDFEKTLATYNEWGAAGIKYGFMQANGKKKADDTRLIVELCAKYELMCNFHDHPIPPSGDVRTYPHYITREYCHAQCDGLRSFTPSTFLKSVFTNMLTGPLDMNNGWFTLTDLEKARPKVFQPVPSTVVAEAARVLITYSGLAILPDTPDSYKAKADLFTFIAQLPMTWDETRILNGEIGEFITTARRSGDRWFIASCYNEEGGLLDVPLDMLKEGVEYDLVLFEDGEDAHYKTNKESYRVRKMTARKGDIIRAKLAPGGGHALILKPQY